MSNLRVPGVPVHGTVKEARLRALHIKDYMAIKAVDLRFTGTGVTLVSGRNAQGKSTLIDTIWDTICNVKRPAPIRNGERSAKSEVVLEVHGDKFIQEIHVTRHVTTTPTGATDVTLEVRNGQGLPVRRPRELLDALFSAISIDPVEWVEKGRGGLPGKRQQVRDLVSAANVQIPAQLATIASQAGLPAPEPGGDPIEAFGAVRKALEAVRRDHKRDLAAAERELDGYRDAGEATPVDVDVLQQRAADLRREHERQQNVRRASVLASSAHNKAVGDLNIARKAVMEAEERLRIAKLDLEDAQRAEDELEDLPDPSTYDKQVGQAVAINIAADRWKRRLELDERRARQQDVVTRDEAMMTLLQDLERAMMDGASFPAGLKYDYGTGGLTLNGVPFPEQASQAEQLHTGIQVALLSDPKLRLLHVKSGSLLDTDAMRELDRLAKQYGVEILTEVVDESGTKGIVIEGGEVVADNR